jgi:hypothetical protein
MSLPSYAGRVSTLIPSHVIFKISRDLFEFPSFFENSRLSFLIFFFEEGNEDSSRSRWHFGHSGGALPQWMQFARILR